MISKWLYVLTQIPFWVAEGADYHIPMYILNAHMRETGLGAEAGHSLKEGVYLNN